MKQSAKTIDSVSVQYSTDTAISIADECITNVVEYQVDTQKPKRLAANECKTCFYLRRFRVGGTAMTERDCGMCGKPVMYGSTNTDPLCKDCAYKYELCKRCAGDLRMRPRRKLFIDTVAS